MTQKELYIAFMDADMSNDSKQVRPLFCLDAIYTTEGQTLKGLSAIMNHHTLVLAKRKAAQEQVFFNLGYVNAKDYVSTTQHNPTKPKDLVLKDQDLLLVLRFDPASSIITQLCFIDQIEDGKIKSIHFFSHFNEKIEEFYPEGRLGMHQIFQLALTALSQHFQKYDYEILQVNDRKKWIHMIVKAKDKACVYFIYVVLSIAPIERTMARLPDLEESNFISMCGGVAFIPVFVQVKNVSRPSTPWLMSKDDLIIATVKVIDKLN